MSGKTEPGGDGTRRGARDLDLGVEVEVEVDLAVAEVSLAVAAGVDLRLRLAGGRVQVLVHDTGRVCVWLPRGAPSGGPLHVGIRWAHEAGWLDLVRGDLRRALGVEDRGPTP